MRRLKLLAVTAFLTALAVAGVVWATTYHTITVDGNLVDFAADEKTAGDPANDSLYGVDNELTTFYATWDAQKLYLGYDYKIQGGAVMILLNTAATGGVTNLCPAGGYAGSYKANAQSASAQQPFNFMIAFFANQSSPGTQPTVAVYSLGSNNSTPITSASGVAVALVESVSGDKRTGSVEVALPWDVLYGLGAGKVPANATIKIAGLLRGKNAGNS